MALLPWLRRRQPATAALAALMLMLTPAAGMLFLNRWRMGLVYCLVLPFAAFAVPLVVAHVFNAKFDAIGAAEIAVLGVFVVGIVHCALSARRTMAAPRWFARWPFLIVVFGLSANLLVFSVRSFVVEPFAIPAASMRPNLKPGDQALANKMAYGYSRYALPFPELWPAGRWRGRDPVAGDVVVFRSPRDPAITFVKRVVGLPGDQVSMKDGVLVLNGTAVNTTPVTAGPVADAGSSERTLLETLPNGRRHLIIDSAAGSPLDNTKVWTVPEGHVFLLGDHRDNSADSRLEGNIGMVPLDNIVGRFGYAYFNADDNALILKTVADRAGLPQD